MAASLLKQWQLQLCLGGLELTIGGLLPVVLWVTSAAQLYLLLVKPAVELRWRPVQWFLVLSILKSYLLSSPVPCSLLNLYLVGKLAVTPLEESRQGLPSHAKELSFSVLQMISKLGTIPLFCLLIIENPLTSPITSNFTLFGLTSGIQLFLSVTRREILHLHWKLLSVNLVIAAKALLGGYCLYGDVWLGVVALVTMACQLVNSEKPGSSSLFCAGLSLCGVLHMALFPESSSTLLATQISAILLSVLLLSVILSPPLWLIFSAYKSMRVLHWIWLLHFLYPLVAVVDSQTLSYSSRSL